MPETPISGGSQTAASVSSAVHLAGDQARSKLLQLALADQKSPLYSSNAEDVIAQNGSFFLKK